MTRASRPLRVTALAVAALLSAPPLARPALADRAPPVTVRDAWARATPPGATNAAIYLSITSAAADRLLRVTTSAAPIAGLHETRTEGAITRMRAVPDGIPLPPGRTVTLQPGGLHIMLEGLAAPLIPGATLVLHLSFAHAPPLDVATPVRPIGAGGMAGMVMGP